MVFLFFFIGEEVFGRIPAQRMSSSSVHVIASAGQSLTFRAAAQDPKGALQTLRGSVGGVEPKRKMEKLVDLAGGQAHESSERTFPGAGDFYAMAWVSAAGGRNRAVEWRVTIKRR